MPKTNAEFWRRKIERNRARDKEVARALADHGWAIVRIWEHESPADSADQVVRLVKERLERD
jgi:DNA mismatch endonuclease (patch repair protein)